MFAITKDRRVLLLDDRRCETKSLPYGEHALVMGGQLSHVSADTVNTFFMPPHDKD